MNTNSFLREMTMLSNMYLDGAISVVVYFAAIDALISVWLGERS
jgi:hypothetical protein